MDTVLPIKVTNTLTGKKEVLKTSVPGKLTMYSCGPTVYGLIHVGNLRTALVADMFYRFFRRSGFNVNYVRNYTDVDDKIINKAKQEGITAAELAKKYTKEVEKDYSTAGLLPPTKTPTVTGHIEDIVQLISRIIDNGHAYVVDGEVIFSIDSFKSYGKLSHKKIDDLVAGIRVDVNEKKRNPLDFTLWKPAKPGEPFWESPWGNGRPGWHIECSAMSSRLLGDQIDLHHGGEDLIFPHHENEIAQSEAASGKEPFVRYWLHNAFLTISKEKMSKSLGNVFLAREFLKRFGGEFARYMLLSVHYRSIIDFGDEAIENTLVGLQRIYEAKEKAEEIIAGRADSGLDAQWTAFIEACKKAKTEIRNHFANDFNSPAALAELFSLIREFNRLTTVAKHSSEAKKAAEALVSVMEEDIGTVLGFGKNDSVVALKELERIRAEKSEEKSGKISDDDIKDLIVARANARKERNFSEADRIRKDLEAKGILLKDGPSGTTWSYK